MANLQVSLMEYLQRAPQAIPVIVYEQLRLDTASPVCSWRDIRSTGHWQSFNIRTLQQDFGQLLQSARIHDEAFPDSPPGPIFNEGLLHFRIAEYIRPRIRRALRSGFQLLSQTDNMGNYQTVIRMDIGGAASHSNEFAPDLAFFNADEQQPAQQLIRVPGDIIPSYKWSSSLGNSTLRLEQRDFRQALAQVNYYMKQHHTRYGFLFTDQELVAIKRHDSNGNLELATPIPWTTTGNANLPQMTVLLGLWYLGMLASDDTNWRLE